MEEFLKKIEESVKQVLKIYGDERSKITFFGISKKIRIELDSDKIEYIDFLVSERKYIITEETPATITLESTDKFTIEEFSIFTGND